MVHDDIITNVAFSLWSKIDKLPILFVINCCCLVFQNYNFTNATFYKPFLHCGLWWELFQRFLYTISAKYSMMMIISTVHFINIFSHVSNGVIVQTLHSINCFCPLLVYNIYTSVTISVLWSIIIITPSAAWSMMRSFQTLHFITHFCLMIYDDMYTNATITRINHFFPVFYDDRYINATILKLFLHFCL